MPLKKVGQNPRSPTTEKVFKAFVEQLRADPDIGGVVAARMEAALSPGQTINSANLQDALFPVEEADVD